MAESLTFLVTGGAGFIGSAVIRQLIAQNIYQVVNIDKLTYAGNLSSLESVASSDSYHFVQADICDAEILYSVFAEYQPDIVMHLAAETHVDRSIQNPQNFIQTNIIGTFTLLEAARHYWSQLASTKQQRFRFHHISTDEVYGDLGENEPAFVESHAYSPSSPYSASKASSDHLVRAWQRTYCLPALVSNCSNNYGPYQYPEKLIPLTIRNALAGLPLPIYGDGLQRRDWLYVDDHAAALIQLALEGKVGETYNIGGHAEKTNLEVVHSICGVLDELVSDKPDGIINFSELITHVTDRPGHDQRYAVNASKIAYQLGWMPQYTFAMGLRNTVVWYLQNQNWLNNIQMESVNTSASS